MSGSHSNNLCMQIIHTHFGPITASVATVLLTRGRLNFPQIVSYSSQKPSLVRSSLIILIQHNLVWHATSEEGGEVFEFNVEECTMRLRFGRYVWQAEELFGPEGAEIVKLVLDHGKLKPTQIMRDLGVSNSISSNIYTQALYKLVSSSYLKPCTVFSHVSPRDKRIQYEEQERKKIRGFPTSKQLKEAKESAVARLMQEEADAEKIGLVKKAPDPTSNPKKRKANLDSEEIVDESVYFRVNFTKFNIHIRHKLIERAVSQRYNEQTASVVGAILKMTENTQKSLTDVRSDPVTISNIAAFLADHENLSRGLIYPSSKKPSNTTCIKDYLTILSAGDNPTPAGRMASFVSLTSSKVQVEFEVIAHRLKRRVLEAVAHERHGLAAVRIIRLLLETGKMDEKQISKIAMMPSKEVRPLLSSLSQDSLISTQEVPRSADRNPMRTFYLWHVDLNRVYSVLLGSLYKTLYNISMRRQAEKEEPMVKAVLEKRERSDVAEDISLLTTLDQNILSDWETKEEKLTMLEMRVEESVFILRDLGGSGVDDY